MTNHRKLADEVRHFLYYAEFLAEYVYDSAADLPIAIHEDLLWQVGERLYRPIALTCYLFQTQPGEAFPPAPAQPKPEDVEWIEITGSPASGKSTLVLSCLQTGMNHLADDVLFIARDDGLVRVYSFPEDIGIRKGTTRLLGQYEFMQTLAHDQRQKSAVDVQQYFRGQVISSCPVRLMIFLDAKCRSDEFRAELLSPAYAVATNPHYAPV